jgi:hypothetical protein
VIKLAYLVVMLSLLLALMPATTIAPTEDDPLVVDLLAGQTSDIGDVNVWNDADNPYVQFLYTGTDCGFLEVHLQVSARAWPEDIVTKGNPIPRHFEYYDPTSGKTCFPEHTFVINLAEKLWTRETPLMIAAHAAPYSSLSWTWGFGLKPTYGTDIPGVPWTSIAPNTG